MREKKGATLYCDSTLHLTQHAYALRVLERFKMQDANLVLTPLEPGMKFSKLINLVAADEAMEMATIPYHEALGLIMYLSVVTRPDLSYLVQVLS